MSKFFNVRTPVSIRIGEQAHTFYIRELGYLRFMEMNAKTGGPDTPRDERGLALMKAVCLAAIEEEDGTLSYTEDDWQNELQEVVRTLSRAAMKAQGVDLEKNRAQADVSEEDAEGNAEPSRKSGANSHSTSAAPSVN
jgi:hypothetical protein